MNIESLMEVLPETYSLTDRELVRRAYKFAEKAHEGQKRASGEPYITHCVAVASILSELRVPPPVVVAGLLHDTVEDTPTTLTTLRNEFGEEVAKLVDGVTKLTHIPRVSRGDQHIEDISDIDDETLDPEAEAAAEAAAAADVRDRRRELRNETLRKTFLAMGEDIRVVLIKLADRLHNMRTLGYMPETKAQAHRPGNPGYLCTPGQPPGHLADQVGAGRPGFPLRQSRKIQRNRRKPVRTPLRPRKTGRRYRRPA